MFYTQNKSSGLTQQIRVRRCYGCGAILQDQDPNEAGYIPTDKLAKDDDALCERCFKLRHYSKFKETPSLNVDYVTILDHAKEENALAVFVLNAFALEGSLLEGIGKYLPKKVLAVINKRDLLPKNYDDQYLLDSVKALLEKEDIEPLDILLTSSSATKAANIPSLLNDIDKYRDGKNVYFFGAYQVGKSSLINGLLMSYQNKTDKVITTSPYPGTTLDVISIPLDRKSFMYDTPGIYNAKSIISHVEGKILKYVLPRNEIKPEAYQAKPEQSFMLSNIARIDFVSGDRTNFVFFKSNDLTIARAKLNKADDTFNALCKNADLDIRSEKITSLDNMVKVTLKAVAGKKNHLFISGLAVVEFEGTDQTFDVYVPTGVEAGIKA